MKIKVCGMKNHENIKEVLKLKPEFMGFIFYSKSPRYIDSIPKLDYRNTKKVGVFVDEEISNIIEKVKLDKLNFIQLHGTESPDYCLFLKKKLENFDKNVQLIKAFSVNQDFNFQETGPYVSACTYFLFDTKGQKPGGTGKKFDWNILNKYNGETSFLLSGGLTINDAQVIKKLNYPQLFAVDINSGFEIKPGLKNSQEIKKFKTDLV
ncbi:MAG: phosphoribosylanthranilate isomerase [Lutibacter sp.]